MEAALQYKKTTQLSGLSSTHSRDCRVQAPKKCLKDTNGGLTIGSRSRPDDLDFKLYEATPTVPRGLTFTQFRDLKRDDELKFLQSTIQEAGGNKAEAARRLQVTANHLQHLLNGAKGGKREVVNA